VTSNWQPICDETWEAIRTEIALPPWSRSGPGSELMEDPEPVMQRLVRVFIDAGTFCPGFQFLPGGQLHPTVVELFQRAMALKIAQNYFTVWMITPSGAISGSRPVDFLDNGPSTLLRALNPSAG
jgi:hypothetical protein